MSSGSVEKIEAGEAFVRAKVVDETKEPLAAIQRDLKAWGKSVSDIGRTVMASGLAISAAGLAILAPLGAAVTRTEAIGAALVDMSARTGIAIESLAALRHAVEMSDVSFEAFGSSIAKMQKLLASEDRGAVEALGLNPDTLLGMAPEQQFLAIADRIAAIESPAQRAAAAMAVFGKAGTELLPLLTAGSAGIESLMREAERLGLVMDADTAMAAEVWGDTWASLVAQIDHLVAAVGAALIPHLQALTTSIQASVAAAIEFIEANGEIVVAAAATGVGLLALGVIVQELGALLVGLGAIAAALSSPAVLVTAAVVGLGAAVVAATDSWESLAAFIQATWGPLAKEIVTMGADMKAALMIGDVSGAWELFFLNLRAWWQSFVNAWHEGVTIMVEGLVNAIKVATADIIALFSFASVTTEDQLKAWGNLGVEWLDKWRAANAERARNLEETERKIAEIRERSAAEAARQEAAAEADKPRPPDLIVELDEPLEAFNPRVKRLNKGFDLLSELAKTDFGEVAKGIESAFSAIGTTSAEVASRISGFEVDWSRKTADNTGRMVDTLQEMNDHLAEWGPALFA